MTDVNEVKPDTRAKLDQLFKQVGALDAQVDALDLPSRIEFCRLLRIAESSVEFIAMRANELADAKDELRQKRKAVDKAAIWTMGIGLLYLIAGYFYKSLTDSIPLFVFFLAAWYYKAVFDAWDCEQRVEKIKAVHSEHRFAFFSAGFSDHLLDAIAHFAQKESTEAFSDEYMLNDEQIELAIKIACLKLCRGVHDYGYRHTPSFKN